MATTNYIVIVKQMENGKFLVSFPDFEGITTTAETEESIENVASGIIKTKLAELKKVNIEAPEPKKMTEVSKNLKEGEFTTYISVKESFDFKSTMTSLKDKESVKESAKEVKDKVANFVNNVPSGKENLFGICGGVLSILNTLFLAVITVKVPFFGNYSIGFFRGLGDFADYSKDAKNAQFILIFSGVLFLALAGLIIYTSFIKNKNLLNYSIFANIGFLVVFYIVLFIKLPKGDASDYLSVSFFKIFLYLISIALAYLTYRALNNEKGETLEKDTATLGKVLEKEEEEGKSE